MLVVAPSGCHDRRRMGQFGPEDSRHLGQMAVGYRVCGGANSGAGDHLGYARETLLEAPEHELESGGLLDTVRFRYLGTTSIFYSLGSP